MILFDKIVIDIKSTGLFRDVNELYWIYQETPAHISLSVITAVFLSS